MTTALLKELVALQRLVEPLLGLPFGALIPMALKAS
jgi:hypothetical protein